MYLCPQGAHHLPGRLTSKEVDEHGVTSAINELKVFPGSSGDGHLIYP